MNVCKICNKSYSILNDHLLHNHSEFNVMLYYDKFLKVNPNEGLCNYNGCNKKTRFISIQKGYCKHCCKSHAQLNNLVRDKIKKTKLKRYGNINFINIDKIKKTKLERYGDVNYNNRPKSIEKLLARTDEEKNKWIDSVRNTWKSKTISEKQKIYKKYGVTNISYIPEILKLRGQSIKKTWNEQKDNISEQIKKTNIIKYGYEHIMRSPNKNNILFKSHETRLRLGQILPEHLIPSYQKYKSKVYSITKKSAAEKFSDEELGLIGLCGVDGALQIDHIFTVKDGFINNISPQVLGSKVNIQLVNWKINDTKKSKSDISKEQLLYLYNKNEKVINNE